MERIDRASFARLRFESGPTNQLIIHSTANQFQLSEREPEISHEKQE